VRHRLDATGAEQGLRIHLCGVRGSTPAPGIQFVRYGGHTSCVALAHDDRVAPTLLLDAGGGLAAVSRLLGDAPFRGTILLTHLHWDHTLGLPFFAAADRSDSNVSVLVPEQESGADAVSALAGMMAPPYFPIGPTDLRGSWAFASVAPGAHEIEGFSVLAREIPHKGGRTFGYRIGDGRATFTYMPDHCPTVLGAGEHGFGEYHPAAVELARDADLLLHDALLFPEELAAEAEFGHAVGDYAVELAKRAHARSLVLSHHRHDRSDDALDGLALRLGGGDSPSVTVAAEGLVFEL
jgi:ribonuclease BN (tRNA processing enzyme)